MSAEIIFLSKARKEKRRTKELPPRSLSEAVRLAIVMTKSAEQHLNWYAERRTKAGLKALRFVTITCSQKLRRAVEADGEDTGEPRIGDFAALSAPLALTTKNRHPEGWRRWSLPYTPTPGQ